MSWGEHLIGTAFGAVVIAPKMRPQEPFGGGTIVLRAMPPVLAGAFLT